MVAPTFLVIGAQKCGTSWLSKAISQHPDVLTYPKKEVHFFNKKSKYNKGIEWYESQFVGHTGQKAVGEFTPNYFWTTPDKKEHERDERNINIPELVHDFYPHLKLIVSLRNPVDRAVSAYYHHIRARRIAPTTRLLNVRDLYGIVDKGLYAVHLENWLKYYSYNDFLILIYEEDIIKNKKETLKKVFQFIGVDESFKPVNLDEKHNNRSSHFYMRMNYYYPNIAKSLQSRLPKFLVNSELWNIPVYSTEIESLREIYVKENEKLSFLIGRSLPW